MLEELKETIVKRVIGELFQEAEKMIKESVKLTEKNNKFITLGLSLSVARLCHAIMGPIASIGFDVLNGLITMGVMNGHNINTVSREVKKTEQFFEKFDEKKDDVFNVLKIEFTSDLRLGTYFTRREIDSIIKKGILNLRDNEIEMFSKVRFNDNQEEYLKNIISQKEKINVIHFLDLAMIEGSIKNQKYINLGGKNKTLQEIMNPTKKLMIK